MKNPFLKYIMKEKKENIFHSSAYGKAQSADVMGTASMQSFEERMKVDKNRQIVQSYNDSRIVSGSYLNGPKAKKYVPPENKEQPRNFGATKTTAAEPAPKPAPTPVKRSFVPTIKPNFGK